MVAGGGLAAAKELIVAKELLAKASMTPMEAFANKLLDRWMTADQLVHEADGDQSGELDFGEFKDLCLSTLRLNLSEEEITEVFQTVDKDKSGACSSSEMRNTIYRTIKELEAKQLAAAIPDEDEGDVRSNTKLVALVAHNNMKPSMMTFVAQHRDFFKKVQITTTGSTGAALEKKLALKIARKVASGPLGGDQEIGGMITTDDVGAAFFFIDPLSAHPHEADIRALTRICEVHNTACATNPVSGEALVFAFENSPKHRQLLMKDFHRSDSAVVGVYKAGQATVINKVSEAAPPAAA